MRGWQELRDKQLVDDIQDDTRWQYRTTTKGRKEFMFICCQICRNSGGCCHHSSLVRLNTLAGTLLYSSRRSNTTFRGFVNPGSTVFQDIFYLAYSYSPSIVSEYPMAWYKVVQFTRIYPDGPTITRLGTSSQDEMRYRALLCHLYSIFIYSVPRTRMRLVTMNISGDAWKLKAPHETMG